MAKYIVLSNLWSPSQNKMFTPGEVVELDTEIAIILMDKLCVKPADTRRNRKIRIEVKDDTDNQ